jgi:DNA integrity scanning protein DisA with diadenylate cyclase activity
MNKNLKTNHLQVLVDDEMLLNINRVINLKALEEGTRPKAVSAYVRNLIQKEIDNHEVDLKFYTKEITKRANRL